MAVTKILKSEDEIAGEPQKVSPTGARLCQILRSICQAGEFVMIFGGSCFSLRFDERGMTSLSSTGFNPAGNFRSVQKHGEHRKRLSQGSFCRRSIFAEHRRMWL